MSGKRSRPQKPQTRPAAPTPWWRRPLIWGGSIVTALVIAIVTAVGTGIGNGIFSATVRHHTAPTPTPSLGVNQEVRNNQAAYDTNTTQAWAIPDTLSPTSAAARIIISSHSVSGYETPDSYIDRFDNWVFAHGGATVGVTYLRLTLTGGSQPTVIQSVCAHIIKRTKILTGTLFFKGAQGNEPVETTLNLDSSEPCANYFKGHYLPLSPGQSAVVNISATAHSDTVSWDLFLDATVNGKQKFIPVGSNEVLRTTAALRQITGYGAYYQFTYGAGASMLFRPTVPDSSDQQDLQALAR
jgi:hypothetical protein